MAQFNPFDPANAEDPFPALAELRAQCPVSQPTPGLHVIAQHQDCVQAMRDWQHFSSAGGASLSNDMPAESVTINATDGSFHISLRRMMQSVLRPVNFAAERASIEAMAVELIEEFLPLGEVDLVEALANKLPARVILKLMGIPDEDYKLVRGWTEDIERSADSEKGIRMADFYSRRYPHPAVDAFDNYIQALLDDRRSGRVVADDLVARVSAFEPEDGRTFSDNEIRSNLAFLLIAGNHTTGNLIGNLFAELAADPALYARLRADRSLVDRAIEESLRLSSPVQGVFRVATDDVSLADASIGEQDKLFLSLASANRDERNFADADHFDIDREHLDKHIAFGYGVHFCIGAPLARLEAKLAVDAFLDRVQEFHLEPGASTGITTRNVTNRGPSSLKVRFTTVAA